MLRAQRDRGRGGRLGVAVASALLASLAPAALAPAGATPSTGPNRVVSAGAGRLLLGYAPGTSETARQAVRDRLGAALVRTLAEGDDGPVELVGLSVDRPAVLAALADDPTVRYAEPDAVARLAATPDDPFFLDGRQWGMYGEATTPTNPFGTGAAALWSDGRTGSRSVYVALLDSGIDRSHPDLAANVWTNPFDPANGRDDDGNGFADDVNGWNFATWDREVDDRNGHGTHVAGIVGAVGGNTQGVAGMAWDVQLVTAKLSGTSGTFPISNAVDAIRYVTDLKTRHGLPIVAINASWTTTSFSVALYDAIADAGAAGILVVAAAGNAATDLDATPVYPAAYDLDNIVTVAALTSTGQLAAFSNVGATTVDLAAPGAEIFSTWPVAKTSASPYRSLSGTSMAAPHVTGALALCSSIAPSRSTTSVRNAVLDATSDTPALRDVTVTGGRLDVSGLLAACTVPPPAPTDLTATPVSSTSIELTWTDNASDETGFTVERATGTGPWVPLPGVASDVTRLLDTGLEASTTYRYRVRAANQAGVSAWSSIAGATTSPPELPPVPAAPSGLTAIAVSSTSIDVAWTDNADNETSIELEMAVADGPWRAAASLPADTEAWTATGLTPATLHRFRARTVNDAGGSSWSDPATATTHPPLFTSVTPTRLFDTRDGTGGVPVGTRPAGSVLEVAVPDVLGDVPAVGVSALSLNLTVTQAEQPGYVTVTACGQPTNTSNLNFLPSQTVANAVIAPVGPGTRLCFRTSATTHLLADVNGWFSNEHQGFTPVTPARLFDTRLGDDGATWAAPADAEPAEAPDTGGPPTGAASTALLSTPGGVLVGYARGTTDGERARVRRAAGAVLVDAVVGAATARRPVDLVRFPAPVDLDLAARLLATDPAVAYVEPNATGRLAAMANDPYYTSGDLWGMYGDTTTPANDYGSQAGEAWADDRTGSDQVIVAVLDSGLDTAHPDLAANVWTNPFDPVNGRDDDGNGKIDDVHGWDVVQDDNDPQDTEGHGTHVAGTIGAVGGNATGVAGVAWDVSLLPVRLAESRSIFLADEVEAIDYVIDLKRRHGLPIVAINASWGNGTDYRSLYEAVTRAQAAGIVVVAAAGNGGVDGVGDDIDTGAQFPAAYDLANVVSVAALTPGGDLASFSNFGARSVDLAAPGVGVLSTAPGGGYTWKNGTSMAAPHVTGAVALCAARGGLTGGALRQALLGSARPTAALAGRTATGGRLDVAAMVTACRGKPTSGSVVRVPVGGRFGVPTSGVAAVSLNLTVTEAEAPGYVTAFDCAHPTTTSNLNYTAGQTVAGAVIAPVGDDGAVCLFVYGATHLLADVNGWFAVGGGFGPSGPTRLFDTRVGIGGTAPAKVPARSVLQVPVTGRAGVPSSGVAAVSLTVTATGADEPGYVTVYGCGATPVASNLNHRAGDAVANAVITPVGPGGTICLYAYGATHLIADVTGWFAST